jgi:hypothetical protein
MARGHLSRKRISRRSARAGFLKKSEVGSGRSSEANNDVPQAQLRLAADGALE